MYALGFQDMDPVASMPLQQFSASNRDAKWREHLQLQEFCLLLLQAEGISLDQRMALLGVGLHKIDEFYAKGESRNAAAYMDCYLKRLSGAEDTGTLLPSEQLSPTFLLGYDFLAPDEHLFAAKGKAILENPAFFDSLLDETCLILFFLNLGQSRGYRILQTVSLFG